MDRQETVTCSNKWQEKLLAVMRTRIIEDPDVCNIQDAIERQTGTELAAFYGQLEGYDRDLFAWVVWRTLSAESALNIMESTRFASAIAEAVKVRTAQLEHANADLAATLKSHVDTVKRVESEAAQAKSTIAKLEEKVVEVESRANFNRNALSDTNEKLQAMSIRCSKAEREVARLQAEATVLKARLWDMSEALAAAQTAAGETEE